LWDLPLTIGRGLPASTAVIRQGAGVSWRRRVDLPKADACWAYSAARLACSPLDASQPHPARQLTARWDWYSARPKPECLRRSCLQASPGWRSAAVVKEQAPDYRGSTGPLCGQIAARAAPAREAHSGPLSAFGSAARCDVFAAWRRLEPALLSGQPVPGVHGLESRWGSLGNLLRDSLRLSPQAAS